MRSPPTLPPPQNLKRALFPNSAQAINEIEREEHLYKHIVRASKNSVILCSYVGKINCY